MGRLISIYEASRLLGVTPPTVYGWVGRGILTGHRDSITGRLFVELDEVERLAPDRRIRPVQSGGRGGRVQ
ncbi:MAG: hypothetical protein QME70_09615 [Bacillota bacterium]|nr:hypothetical protein [Bacillota bacterium]